MKKLFLFLGFNILSILCCWSQGQISRPTNTQSSNKSTREKEKILPNSSETINGITVNWNGVTQKQKVEITELLNNMVYVEGGSFMMGSDDPEAENNEKPVHKQDVNSFWIAKYETTQKLWKIIMSNNPSNFKGDNLPVETISWRDCQDFIEKLNLKTGLHFRLPTESEWEYAAKGGKKSKGFKYSGSDDINDVAWYEGNSHNSTHTVGKKLPNELGIFDMSGNVWEWTFDKYSKNYQTVNETNFYVARGGNWDFPVKYQRITSRANDVPNSRSKLKGFRLAL